MELNLPSDPGKNVVQTGIDNKITAFWVKDFQYTALGMFIIYRLIQDRDAKILITGSGKTTGTGKTTIAIILAHWINTVRNSLFNMNIQWSAEAFAFMDVWEYLEKYAAAQPGDCLITDELEVMADRRRHQTHQNVYFSQAWSMLRYKNVFTIGTAPGLMDLEKRIPEAADIWINVVQKGRANVYYITVNDFEWMYENPLEIKRMKMLGYRETLLWPEIDDNPDYKWLKSKKESKGVPGITGVKKIDEKDLEQAKSDAKKTILIKLLKHLNDKGLLTEFSQENIGDITGYSQQQVSKIKRQLEKEGEI